MTEYSNNRLDEYIRAVGNNFPLKKFHQEGWKMFFNTFDGKIILDCQIFSFHANDGIFRH
jgi:hypothetical protein